MSPIIIAATNRDAIKLISGVRRKNPNVWIFWMIRLGDKTYTAKTFGTTLEALKNSDGVNFGGSCYLTVAALNAAFVAAFDYVDPSHTPIKL